jgi:uncharacterized phage-associated protein
MHLNKYISLKLPIYSTLDNVIIKPMSINQKKYQQTILYFCQTLGGRVVGKKKLVKLLYFADFDCFEKNNAPITGDIYKKLPMGPFPQSFDDVTKKMTEEGSLSIEKILQKEGFNPTEIYICKNNVDESLFSKEEKEILDRVVIKYGHLNGKQLENLSHAEAPYIASNDSQEIPYELAYYRDTDFDDK